MYSDSNKRLLCHLRPDDLYSKPACADRTSCTSMLLRVRRRRKKKQPDDSNAVQGAAGSSTGGSSRQSESDYEYDGKVLGLVGEMYKFQCEYY